MIAWIFVLGVLGLMALATALALRDSHGAADRLVDGGGHRGSKPLDSNTISGRDHLAGGQ